jgi:23S rRNA pseudouridine1911/1915/1917 synthase
VSGAFDFQVEPQQEGRLDKFLTSKLPDHSRSRLQALIKEGNVQVNGNVITKTGWPLNHGDQVNIKIPEPVATGLQSENIPLNIIFENSDLVVLNKPAGMVVHPAPGHDSGTLVNAALGRLDDLEGIGGEIRPGIVHRLDKDTSGVIIIAKNERSLVWLQDQFKSRKVQKVYLALADGKPPTPTGRIEAAIARDPAHRKQMAIVSEGKGRRAVTEYKTLHEYSAHTLIEAHPLTGRTHQIRLHLAFIKCPIVGDKVYGKKKPTLEIERHFLHAERISIILPGEKEARTFTAPLPDELQKILDSLH